MTLDLTKDNYGNSQSQSHDGKANDNVNIKISDPLKNSNSSHATKLPPQHSQQAKDQPFALSSQPMSETNGKQRPRPRPVSKKQTNHKSTYKDELLESLGSTILGSAAHDVHTPQASSQDVSVRQRARSRSCSKSKSRSKSRRPVSPFDSTFRKYTPAAFPAISPPSSPHVPTKTKAADFPTISPLSEVNSHLNNGSRHQTQKGSCSQLPNPFPIVSPPPKGREDTEEMRERLRVDQMKDREQAEWYDSTALFSVSGEEHNENDLSCVSSKMGKGKVLEEMLTAEKYRQRLKKLNKFPMSTQILASIDASPHFRSSWRGKRSSEGGSEDERTMKKSKTELDTYVA